MAKKVNNPQATTFAAYSSFDWDGKHYEAGDVFALPSGLTRDVGFEELRNLSREKMPKDNNVGIPFLFQVKIAERRNPETGQMETLMDTRRVILPVEEKAGE